MSNSTRNRAQPLGVKAAARELDLSEAYVRRLADNGTLPHTRDSSGKRLFAEADVRQFKKQRTE